MALLDVKSVVPQEERNRLVRILSFKQNEETKFTTYVIQINVGDYTWTVERRYSDFAEFDRRRFKDQKRSFLPPKKMVGNTDTNFLIERRSELEKYLRTTVELELWLQQSRNGYTMPKLLAKFLDFHQYEVQAIVEDLSERLARNGDKWLNASTSQPKYFEFTPIELSALTNRLKLSIPTTTGVDSRSDIAHTVEFLHKMSNLKIRGAHGYVGTSNILWNSLSYSLHFCKNLAALWMADCDATMLSGTSSIRKTTKCLVAHYSLQKLSDILSDHDSILDIDEHEPWPQVTDVDFSFNQLDELDKSVILIKRVETLNLSHNSLTSIGVHLQHLTALTELNLSFNGIEYIRKWHTKLGNLKRLVLAGNSIRSLRGLRKLYSLHQLDVRDNAIAHIGDVWPIGQLPCLEQLMLSGNPIESIVEYRTRVLESFGERAKEILLDGERGSQREIDTVGVRLAIRKAKDDKEALIEKTRLQIGERLKFINSDSDFNDNNSIIVESSNDRNETTNS